MRLLLEVGGSLVHLLLFERRVVLLIAGPWGVGLRHLPVFVEDVQEIWVRDYIIKTGCEQAHELIQFTSSNTFNILRNDINKVIFLDDADVVGVKGSELAI